MSLTSLRDSRVKQLEDEKKMDMWLNKRYTCQHYVLEYLFLMRKLNQVLSDDLYKASFYQYPSLYAKKMETIDRFQNPESNNRSPCDHLEYLNRQIQALIDETVAASTNTPPTSSPPLPLPPSSSPTLTNVPVLTKHSYSSALYSGYLPFLFSPLHVMSIVSPTPIPTPSTPIFTTSTSTTPSIPTSTSTIPTSIIPTSTIPTSTIPTPSTPTSTSTTPPTSTPSPSQSNAPTSVPLFHPVPVSKKVINKFD